MDLAIKNENLLVDVSKVKTGKTNYDNRNKIFANWCKKNNLSQDLDSLKKYLAREDIGVSTKNNTKIAVKSALKKIHKNNPERLRELEDNFKELETGKKQTIAINPNECYSEKEIDFIIKELSKKIPSKKFNTDLDRYKKFSLIVWTLFHTGLRISELISIRLDKLYLNGIAKIKVTGKGRKEREIFLPRKKVDEIKKLFNSQVYLFENNKNKKYDRVNLTKTLKKEIELVYPEKNFHPHLLRHSFATNQIISKKKSVKAISNYLGHSSTAITQDLYVHDNLDYKDLFE